MKKQDLQPQLKEPGKLRSTDIFSLFSPRTGWRLARGVTRALFEEAFAGKPLAVCWFTNFSCNAKCHFCCKAQEIREGRERFPPLSFEKAQTLLEKIRASVDLLYLSGGEPLMHPLIEDIVAEAKRQEFMSVGISSNLTLLHKKPGILDNVDAISCSIHAPSVTEHANNLGVPVKMAQQVFDNLKMLEECASEKGIRVIINCVINLKNMDTVRQMVDFTGERGFLLEVVPANDSGRIPTDLHENPDYLALIDELISMRKSGQASHLAGSTHYLKRIRDFKPFRCFPYGVPNIMPDGSLCTPCDVAGQYAVNVMNHENLKAAVKVSRPYLGEYPCKKGMCFKAGIIERSRLFGLLSQEEGVYLS